MDLSLISRGYVTAIGKGRFLLRLMDWSIYRTNFLKILSQIASRVLVEKYLRSSQGHRVWAFRSFRAYDRKHWQCFFRSHIFLTDLFIFLFLIGRIQSCSIRSFHFDSILKANRNIFLQDITDPKISLQPSFSLSTEANETRSRSSAKADGRFLRRTKKAESSITANRSAAFLSDR